MLNWDNYFLSTAGASATLTGLIFVGLSLNLHKILAFKHLPGRALGSFTLLTNILIVSTFCLVPYQPTNWLAYEILFVETMVAIIACCIEIKMYRSVEKKYKAYNFQNSTFTILAISPFFIAGNSLLNSHGRGYGFGCSFAPLWLIAGITFSFIKALIDAWVLLVEINR